MAMLAGAPTKFSDIGSGIWSGFTRSNNCPFGDGHGRISPQRLASSDNPAGRGHKNSTDIRASRNYTTVRRELVLASGRRPL